MRPRGRRYFALRRDLLLPMAAKVGKNAIQTCGLKIRPRYARFKLGTYYHTFTQIFLCRSDKGLSQQQRRCHWLVRRTTLSVLPSHRMSGSGAKGTSVRHTARYRPCSVTAWYMVSQPKSHSVGGFLNRRFEWRFWERSERRRWRMQRGERVAAVKISSARRKAAQKFWAPQQRLAAMGKSRSRSEPRNLSACGHSRETAPIPHPPQSAHPPPRGTSRSAARR